MTDLQCASLVILLRTIDRAALASLDDAQLCALDALLEQARQHVRRLRATRGTDAEERRHGIEQQNEARLSALLGKSV
jgi:hypothetical protein